MPSCSLPLHQAERHLSSPVWCNRQVTWAWRCRRRWKNSNDAHPTFSFDYRRAFPTKERQAGGLITLIRPGGRRGSWRPSGDPPWHRYPERESELPEYRRCFSLVLVVSSFICSSLIWRQGESTLWAMLNAQEVLWYMHWVWTCAHCMRLCQGYHG